MKWLKRHKRKIIWLIQCFLTAFSMISGFWFWYMFIWFLVGLPVVWYWSAMCNVAAALSTLGVYVWVMKT